MKTGILEEVGVEEDVRVFIVLASEFEIWRRNGVG